MHNIYASMIHILIPARLNLFTYNKGNRRKMYTGLISIKMSVNVKV